MPGSKRSTARRFRKWRRRRARRRVIALLAVVVLGTGITGLLLGPLGEPSSEQLFEKAVAHRESGEFAATIIELKSALRQNPKDTAIRISLGNTYMQLSDFISAEKEFRRALEFGASADEVLEPLARALQLQEKYEHVLEEIWPDGLVGLAEADIYVARGRAYASLGQPEKARESYRQALQIVPQHLEALIETARLAIQRNNTKEADQTLRRVRALSPKNLEATALQGDLYLKTGQYDEAVDQYQAVLVQLPGHVLTKVALAEAYFRQGSYDHAATLLDEALLRVPNNFDANYLNAAIAMKNDDYETALKRAERALFSDSSHIPSLAIAGSAAFALGQLELAELNLNKVVARDPDHKMANQLLSALREQRAATAIGRRKPRPSDQSFTRLIDDSADPATVAAAIDPTISIRQALKTGQIYLAAILSPRELGQSADEASADFLTIRQLVSSGNADKAIELLERILADNPGSLQVRTLLAETNLRSGRAEKAFGLVETELIRQVANPELLTIGAIASLATNQPGVARFALQSLEDLRGPAVQVHYLLALAHDQLGNFVARDERLEGSLAIDPDYAPAIAERARVALSRTRLDDAERDIKKLGIFSPNHPEYFDLAAGLALLRAQPTDAARLYQRAFNAEPTSVRALRLAYAEHRLGRRADSVAVLKNWLGQQPDDTAVTLVLANKYLTSEELVDAAELYAIILRQQPNHIVALNNLAWISLKLDDHAAAEKFARQGLALSPGNARLMETLADVHLAEGKHTKALLLLERATKQGQANPGLQVKLARVLAENGNRARALTVLRQTLDANGDFLNRGAAERLLAELDE